MQYDWRQVEAKTRLSAAEAGHFIKTMVGADGAAWTASQALKEAGGKVYVVGGAVRDALLQKEPKDIDLMVSGIPPEDVNNILEHLPGRVDLTGKRFGVYRYHTKGQEVEIALPRTDSYEPGGTRGQGQITVDHHLPIEKDLQRRDFTANSMAVDLDSGRLVDPFGGCFTGDTRISLLDGSVPRIDELIGQGDVWVYSARPDGTFAPGKGRARLTKHVRRLIDVILDSGQVARCTPEHLWMRVDGTYCAAQALRPGDSLMPLYRQWPDKGGYERISGRWPRDWTHRIIYEAFYGKIPPRYHVHHKNEISIDNRPENLEALSPSVHATLTGKRRVQNDPDWNESLKSGLAIYNALPETKAAQKIRAKAMGRANKARNHKVRSIRVIDCDSPVPVYDLEVDEWHNFALSIGCFVHNSRDIESHSLRNTHPGAFDEDPTRLIRALTMHSRHGLVPDEQTRQEMAAHAYRLDQESPDALKQQLEKLLVSANPASAIRLAHETGVLKHLFPELDTNWDFDQANSHHNYSLGEHSANVLDKISQKTKDPDLRLAAMLHDAGKPASAWTDPSTGQQHFYPGMIGDQPVGTDHAKVGADLAESRLRETFNYPVSKIRNIHNLINLHMFPQFSSPKGARKFLAKAGDAADDLLTLREADNEGKGTDTSYKTPVDHMRGLVEQVRTAGDPTSQSAISVDGNDLIALGLKPGPAVGQVLRQLTDEVVANPASNDRETLLNLAREYINAQPEA